MPQGSLSPHRGLLCSARPLRSAPLGRPFCCLLRPSCSPPCLLSGWSGVSFHFSCCWFTCRTLGFCSSRGCPQITHMFPALPTSFLAPLFFHLPAPTFRLENTVACGELTGSSPHSPARAPPRGDGPLLQSRGEEFLCLLRSGCGRVGCFGQCDVSKSDTGKDLNAPVPQGLLDEGQTDRHPLGLLSPGTLRYTIAAEGSPARPDGEEAAF